MVPEHRISGSTAVLRFPKRLLSSDAFAMRNAIHGLVDRGITKLIFDLARVEHLDIGGLSAIVCGWAAATKRGGEALVLNPSPKALHLIELIRLQSLFEIYTDEAAALSRLDSTPVMVAAIDFSDRHTVRMERT